MPCCAPARSVTGGPLTAITGQLHDPRYADVAAPAGALRYRVVAVDRDGVRSVGDTAAAAG